MPDSPDQIIRKLQQENKNLKKILKQKDEKPEQKGEELNLERRLWNSREAGWDSGASVDLHRIEVLDGAIWALVNFTDRITKFNRSSKTIVFGLITLDGEGFFQRYGSFTGKEFVEFLKAACEKFGKILMITDGAPQHRSKFVREEIGRLDGVGPQFLPPGCPDLNAIEEV